MKQPSVGFEDQVSITLATYPMARVNDVFTMGWVAATEGTNKDAHDTHRHDPNLTTTL
jgi:hypothetical protein